jgi:cell division protein FtsQ
MQAILRDPCSGVRSGNLFSKRDSAVLDAPEPVRASSGSAGFKRRAAVTEMPLRRDSGYSDDYSDATEVESHSSGRRRPPAVRVSFSGSLLPQSRWGRITAAAGFLIVVGSAIAGALWVRGFLLHDEHFLVPGSQSIQIAGNSHVTRAQLLSVFGEDVDRNVFAIPLAQRQAELESLPWVEKATVMRLLPNRVRVAIMERTPVAFVHQGSEIGLVDANGVLFDLPSPDTAQTGSVTHYSFPVLAGIAAGDPLSTRSARMKIYLDFITALDSTGEGISRRLSEVDVSNPEDVKAVVSDPAGRGADVLVHFGEEKYLDRYHRYQEHLAEWRTQYPKLSSVDMRYEQQVVLEMQKDATVPTQVVANSVPANAGGLSILSATAGTTPARTVAPVAKMTKKTVTKKQSDIRRAELLRTAGLRNKHAATGTAQEAAR